MSQAFYYPHSSVEHEGVLKTALLLWDDLAYIIPYPGFRRLSSNPVADEAVELIGVAVTPTNDERRRAHNRIMELAESDLPAEFKFDPENHQLRYEIFTSKFLPETWAALRSSSLAAPL